MLDAFAVALAILFLVSAIDKVVLVGRRTAQWHPIALALGRMRRHTGAIFLTSAALDGLAAVMIVSGAALGTPLAFGLLLAYSVVGHVTPSIRSGSGSCHCFGGLFDAPGASFFLARNLFLLGAAVVLLLRPHPGELTAGAVLQAVLMLGAIALLADVARRHKTHSLI